MASLAGKFCLLCASWRALVIAPGGAVVSGPPACTGGGPLGLAPAEVGAGPRRPCVVDLCPAWAAPAGRQREVGEAEGLAAAGAVGASAVVQAGPPGVRSADAPILVLAGWRPPEQGTDAVASGGTPVAAVQAVGAAGLLAGAGAL